MNSSLSKTDVKTSNRSKIVEYIQKRGRSSRQEISRALHLSLPTVISIVNDLIEYGMIIEDGSFESTGGRKAKMLVIRQGFLFSLGVSITQHHIRFLLLDFNGTDLTDYSIHLEYTDTVEYYNNLTHELCLFLKSNRIEPGQLIGVGVAVPGIVDPQSGFLLRSHILNVSGINLFHSLRKIPYPLLLENDANCAAFAELSESDKNTAYFSLSDSVGGAIYIDGKLHSGNNLRAGEFGHMILHPNGVRCYCGKAGCFDSYCSTGALLNGEQHSLEEFFSLLERKNSSCLARWDTYLENLAMAVTNIRMAFDCNVVLGGYIGSYMGDYMDSLSTKAAKYNMFEQDTSYLRAGKNGKLSSALGAAKKVVSQYIKSIEGPIA